MDTYLPLGLMDWLRGKGLLWETVPARGGLERAIPPSLRKVQTGGFLVIFRMGESGGGLSLSTRVCDLLAKMVLPCSNSVIFSFRE